MLALTLKAAIAGRMRPREVAKVAALMTLAKLAYDEGSLTYRMHVGAARGVFRRAAARRLAA